MRCGVFVPQGWRLDLVGIDVDQHWGVMAGLAQRFDAQTRWESIWVYDHFHTVPEPLPDQACYEAWTLMSALAAVTSRVRLGQMCTCMGYRNPAYLAKVAATVDVISEGRVEMGIGGGWYEHEWRGYGYGFPGIGDRLGALREGVEVFRQMWTTGTSTFSGTYVTTDGAQCAPRPLQGTTFTGSPRNGIPIWVAGGGERKTLRIAAEYADYTNFFGDVEEFQHKSAVLAEHCREIGRDPSEITRSSNLNIVIGRDEREVEDRLDYIGEQYRRGGASEAAAERAVAGLRSGAGTGTPEQLLERLGEMEQVGMTYVITYFAEVASDLSGVELFEDAVLPNLT